MAAIKTRRTRTRDDDFIDSVIGSIPSVRYYPKPSEWIEGKRIMPEGSPRHGPFRWIAPYFKDMIDDLHPDKPVREIVIMGPIQTGKTASVIENGILYFMDTAPEHIIYAIGNKDLAEAGMGRLDQAIDTIEGLRGKLGTQAKAKSRRSGDVTYKKEFPGGSLLGIGGFSAAQMRHYSVKVIFADDIDAWPLTLGKEGRPDALLKNRTAAYSSKRKIVWSSTATNQDSHIYRLYLLGNQLHCNLPCPRCERMIVLHPHIPSEKAECGQDSGLIFEHENNIPIPGSVRYRCQLCAGEIWEREKSIMFPEYKWIATAAPKMPDMKSYWYNALYAPLTFFSWIDMVNELATCFDFENRRITDMDGYKSYRNTKEAKIFEERGRETPLTLVVRRKRLYALNTIPFEQIIDETGKPPLLVTAGCDVHQGDIHLLVIAWGAKGRQYIMRMEIIEGDTAISLKGPWLELKEIITTSTWEWDNRLYGINCTFIDVQYRPEQVKEFCRFFQNVGAYPVIGDKWIASNVGYKPITAKTREEYGIDGFHANTGLFKRRIQDAFYQDWKHGEPLPEWYMNFPSDVPDSYLETYTTEKFVELKDKATGQRKGFAWVLCGNKQNHFFDCTVYNHAALELIATQFCKYELGLDALNWPDFWEHADKPKRDGTYFYEVLK